MRLSTDVDTSPAIGPRVAVLMPALDEAGSVGGAVAEWRQLGLLKVLVVDNGSTDATAAVARNAGAQVVTEPQRGYGAAVWRGLRDLPRETDWVLIAAADGSDALTAAEWTEWQSAVALGADLVIGERVSRPESRARLKPVQRLGNWLTCRVLAWGWGHRFAEMGALRLIRVDTLRRLNLRDRAFGWNVEMQVRALEHGLRIVELPVTYQLRRAGESKISGNWRGTLRAGAGILRMLWFLWQLRRPGSAGASTAAAPSLPGRS